MPWAGEGKISQSPIVGGMEITEKQYATALGAMMTGKTVTVRGGFQILGGALPIDADEPTVEDYATAVQNFVDTIAKAREFNDGVTAATYLTSTIPQWRADAEVFVAWRDTVWAYSYGELDKVRSGVRQQPAIDAFINELPAIEWPTG